MDPVTKKPVTKLAAKINKTKINKIDEEVFEVSGNCIRSSIGRVFSTFSKDAG